VSIFHAMTFEEWRNAYAHRVMLMARFKTLAFAMEHLPHNDILMDCWQAGENPNEAADEEMAGWEE
jgi:hypothetical protein